MLSLLSNDPVLLSLDQLRMDGGTQSRASTDSEVVVEYRHIYQDGGVEAMPPVHAIHDGINYWLWDGFHRVKAASGLLDALYVIVEPGTQEEAQWRSYSANRTHGLRRTSADKARAVKAALRHTNAQSMSDRALGDHLGVDGKTVARYRREMELTAEIPQSVTRTGKDGRTINTEQIGRTVQQVFRKSEKGIGSIEIDVRPFGAWYQCRSAVDINNDQGFSQEWSDTRYTRTYDGAVLMAAGHCYQFIDKRRFSGYLSLQGEERANTLIGWLQDANLVGGDAAAPEPTPEPELESTPKKPDRRQTTVQAAPAPASEYEWNNERALNYEMLIGVFRSALDAIPEFEQLTGIFTHSPAARRAMEQLIADLTEQKEAIE